MTNADNDLGSVSIARAASQGFLLLPSIPTPINPGAGFSTALAASARSNPFITNHSPFDQDGLQATKFVYHKRDNCRGTYLSSETSSSSSAYDHLSLSLGVSVGNAILGASVTGSYDKAVLEDRALNKVSRKTSFQIGAIQFHHPPPLSAESRHLLQTSGFDAFKARYGDFYVCGVTLGGDAAVLVSQTASKSELHKKLKVQVTVEFLFMSATETVADEEFSSATLDMQVGVTAFDTLDRSFAEFSQRNGNALGFEEARRLVQEYAERVEQMPGRIGKRIEGTGIGKVLVKGLLSWEEVGALLQADVVNRLVLVPFANHREVLQILNTEGRHGGL